jgi:hypothetical protein
MLYGLGSVVQWLLSMHEALGFWERESERERQTERQRDKDETERDMSLWSTLFF